ncbi:BNR repeat-containing protein [Rhodococcus sp. B10]|uniref:BNR repeat-containing protein n=1 Tax=Rhodococcus sp. B10 TaxID=2695876 RepID=UPI001431C045|nr:BNR repeat-containing protein [Rhodococcus sp. B10]NIL77582.1 hypothetical protein [Rhodococcus sp. B10]
MDILAIDEAAADAAAKYTLGKKANSVRLDVPPTLASGQTRYNATSFAQPVATDGNDLYVAVYNTAGALTLHKRTLPLGAWTTFDLSAIAGNPLALPVDTDSHNTASIFVDAQGYIHVAANMHGDAMRYVRSTNPRDITAWNAPGMTGTNEAQVTYPRFAMHPDGTLFLLYRDGASGMGDLYLNRKPVGGVWTQVGKIADGKTTSENPYETRFVIDRQGRLNIGFTWRPNGGDHNTNADVHFLRSDDKGATWRSVTGTTVTLPLTHANTSARALATAATNSGIINQFGLDVDTAGRPHMALTLADGTAPDRNVHHLWWNGTNWVNDQVTNLGNGMGYNEIPTRPVMICSDNGRALIAYSSPRFGPTIGTYRMIDVTDSTPVDFPIALIDGRDAELTVDERALREKNIYRTIVTSANGDVTSVGPEYNALDNWSAQLAAVLSVDLDLISEVAQRKVRLPSIEVLGTLSLPENLTVLPPQVVTVTGAPTGGTFTLSIGGQTTAPIAWNASAAVVQAALGSLSSVGVGKVQVSGAGPYTVTFDGFVVGTLTASASGLTGGTSPAVTIANSSTLAIISTSAPAFVTPRDARNRRLFAQLAMRARIDSAGSGKSLTIMVREVKQGGTSRNFGTLQFTGGSTSIAATPWMPLNQFASGANADIFVDHLASCGGGAVGVVSASSLRVGALDGPIFY